VIQRFKKIIEIEMEDDDSSELSNKKG